MLEGHVSQVENTRDPGFERCTRKETDDPGFERCTRKETDDPGSSCTKDIKRLMIWSFSTILASLWLLHGSALE